MSEADIQEVKSIEEECRISPWSLLDYRNEIQRSDSIAFVVKEQAKVVGFVTARLITNPKLMTKISQESTESEIEIYNIAVKPHFQKQGIGQRLINQVIEKTTDIQLISIWLEVRKSNIKAVKFYGKNGFSKISERKNFYRNPVEDGIIMNKTLKNY